MKGNNNNLHENNISELKFDKKLADQEWINERDFFRNILFGISATCIPFLTDVNISSYLVTEHGFQNFFINQNRFVSHSLIKNKFFGIDITFENNDDYVEMLEYVKCIDLNDFAKYNGFDINISSLICTGYAYSKLKKSSNSEIKKIIKSADAGSEGLLSLRRREMSKDDLLVAEKIPLADKKEFSKILSSANELPGTEMKCVTQLILKHQDYDPAFFAQGIDNWQLNLNGSKDQVEQWMKDWHRSVFCVNGKISNGSVSELASRYSRDLIFLFFNPEYFFKNEKPGEELIDFYVALNSLLSITEKENAKAILNSDDAKLTDQQKEIKKKLSGHDRNFCKNVINEWKNRFFLDNNPNLTDEFKAKEQKFKEEFNKINLDDLRSKCFVYTKSGKFKEVIDWLIDEIKNDNLDLINKKGNSQQNSLNKNSLTRESLVGALFSGAKIVDKNSEKYLQFDDDKCQEYADKTLDEKIKLIYSEIQFCPEAKKILKPSDFNGTAFCYGNLKSDRLFEFLYEDEFKTKEQKFKEEFNKINLDDLRSKCFVYTKSGEFREVIGWLVDEIKNGHLNLTSERENLHHQLFNKNILTRESLVDKLFSGAKIVDKDNQEYLKFNGDECQKYADKKLDEKIKLIYSEIQFCPEAEKILKPSDFKPTWTNLDKDKYKYGRLKSERLSEFLYFANDEQKYNYIYLRENKNYYRDYILHKDFGENALYNKLYQCTQKADFGKYKREHFIFDETGKIIGMDVLRYFADEISNGNLILKDEDDKDISSQIINRVSTPRPGVATTIQAGRLFGQTFLPYWGWGFRGSPTKERT